MGQLYDSLNGWGCDVKTAVERFMDDDELYVDCLHTFTEDEGFEKLGEYLKSEDYKSAFDCAHTLKGVSANLGLTPIFEVLSKMVLHFRNEENDKAEELFRDAAASFEKFKEIMK